MSIGSSHEAIQHWWIRGEFTTQYRFIQPADTYIRHYCWWCDHCGDVWARLYFHNCVVQMPGSGEQWDIGFNRCLKHGDGYLLDLYVLSRLDRHPIPPQIYERELRREIMKYEQAHSTLGCD